MNSIINSNGEVCRSALRSAAFVVEGTSFEVEVLLQVMQEKLDTLHVQDSQGQRTLSAIGALVECALRSIATTISKNGEVLSASVMESA